MFDPKNIQHQTIFRIVVIALTTILIGFIFNGIAVFVPTKQYFQFAFDAVTASLFYAFLKTNSVRNAIGSVLLFYILTLLLDLHNVWMFALSLVYVVCISLAVFIYMRLRLLPIFNGILQRIATLAILTAFMNVVAILLLELIRLATGHGPINPVVSILWMNFQLGALIGISIGTGIEIAEYSLQRLTSQQTTEIAE